MTTGTLCSMATLGVAWYRLQNNGLRPGVTADVSSPLGDAEMPSMLHTTLKSFRAADPSDPIKVLRLRYFAGLAQGVAAAIAHAVLRCEVRIVRNNGTSVTRIGYSRGVLKRAGARIAAKIPPATPPSATKK